MEEERLRTGLLKIAKQIANGNPKIPLRNNKRMELKTIEPFIHPDQWYQEKVFNPTSLQQIEDMEIVLEFVENRNQRDMWKYFMVYTSSLTWSNRGGCRLQILVKDKTSNKYVGILNLTSDELFLQERDHYIGWKDKDSKGNFVKIQNIANLFCCVPLNPFGFNFNGGKLLASLAFSKEVIHEFQRRYKRKLAGITTTSLYGKSIQYDRLPCLKYIGTTAGYGSLHIPVDLMDRITLFLKTCGLPMSSYTFSRKITKLKRISSILGIQDMSFHGMPKGIYFGFTSPDAKKFLTGEINEESFNYDGIKSVSEITQWWKDRWARQRYQQLITTDRFIVSSEVFPNKILSKKEQHKIASQEYRDKQKEEKKEQKQNNYKEMSCPEDGSILKEGYGDIYLITNIKDGKQYIGQAQHITGIIKKYKHGYLRRWKKHLKDATNENKKNVCIALNNAIRKHGQESFTVCPLLTCKMEYLNMFEKLLIGQLKTKAPNGYNITEGGDGTRGKPKSQQERQRLREANLGKNNPSYGKKQSAEHIAKRIANHSGAKHWAYGTKFSDQYKEKLSNAKLGSKNPNFGKELKESHRQKISQSNKIVKRKINDEQLLEILRYKKGTFTQEKVVSLMCQKYNDPKLINRNNVAQIWSGKMTSLNSQENIEYQQLITYQRSRRGSNKI